MKTLVLAAAMTVACPTPSGAFSLEHLPERLSCPVVRLAYRHYAKQGYSTEQMVAYLRSRGVAPARIEGAIRCVR